MKHTNITIGLVAAVALQFLVLTGMVVKASAPLWTGQEIRIKTIPVDPRSLFRGNYALLNYDISTLPATAFQEKPLRQGETVYVRLEEKNNLYHYAGASLEKPDQGVFLKGRITSRHAPYRVKYGIEAFFAPKQEALLLQKDLRNGGVAILMVTDDGEVALQDIVADPAPATND